MKLADFIYGHGSEFMCSLSGRFSHEKYPDAPPIQICEMKCGCWIVADGNNRVGLILKKNPEATIGDIPERLLATAPLIARLRAPPAAINIFPDLALHIQRRCAEKGQGIMG